MLCIDFNDETEMFHRRGNSGQPVRGRITLANHEHGRGIDISVVIYSLDSAQPQPEVEQTFTLK